MAGEMRKKVAPATLPCSSQVPAPPHLPARLPQPRPLAFLPPQPAF